jgi:hypothetical protein
MEQHEMTLPETARTLAVNITRHFFIALTAGLIINLFVRFDTQAAFILGVSLGAAVSAAKVFLMERGISRSLSERASYAGAYAMLQMTLRNLLSAGLLIWAVLWDGVSIWGALAGLALLQSAAFSIKAKWKGV